MEELYNKFRFKNREFFRRYNANIINFIFTQVSFFLEYNECGQFTKGELDEFVNESELYRGRMIPDRMDMIDTVMDFFCDEFNLSRIVNNRYTEIREIVVSTIAEFPVNGAKFIDPLTREIIDKFNNSEYSATVEYSELFC